MINITMKDHHNDADNHYWKSSDLALVAGLSLSFPIEGIDKTNPHKAIFLFKRSHELGLFIESYYRGELKVNPVAYFQQLKIVKSRLYGDG